MLGCLVANFVEESSKPKVISTETRKPGTKYTRESQTGPGKIKKFARKIARNPLADPFGPVARLIRDGLSFF